ncbi:MAG TPA: ATP-binding protein, partial [Albitalea sp.]|nr:ATP-binding protein [Albitalea sp.]
MNPPPLPADEDDRARLLHRLCILDTPPEPGFDAVARMARLATGCSIGAVTLVDSQRQWFKAADGFELREAPRQHAFCAHTILSDDVFIVGDAAGDGRFADGRLVTAAPSLRFYAGAPLIVDGHRIGAVCGLDPAPRTLDAGQHAALRDLAQIAAALLQPRLNAAGSDRRASELARIAKGEFLSRMSHEMRTPLNAVIGFSQLLLNRSDHPEQADVRDYASHVLRAGEHLLALTNDVLDLQQVEDGRAELEPADVPLDSIVARVIALLSPTADQRGVRFDNHVPAGVAVRADARRLRQVLVNIASNAVKFNRPAGIVRWSVVSDAMTRRVRLSIEDTGSGLKPGQMERLFQPFERLGRETSTIEGTGLGLIIARSLVTAMGGSLQVASRAGVGTRVVVELPLARQTELPFSAEPAAKALPPAAALRLLYVEDNPINAILFEEAIRLREGVELRLAEDGAEALDQVRDWRPDVLVLDSHLPGMNGFELLGVLRRQPGLDAVPAFMCSADAMP